MNRRGFLGSVTGGILAMCDFNVPREEKLRRLFPVILEWTDSWTSQIGEDGLMRVRWRGRIRRSKFQQDSDPSWRWMHIDGAKLRVGRGAVKTIEDLCELREHNPRCGFLPSGYALEQFHKMISLDGHEWSWDVLYRELECGS